MACRTKRRIRKTTKTRRRKRVFKQADYISGDGFLTSIWGPSAWHTLHIISFNYPIEPTPKDKINYRNFVLSLQNVLPCGKCRANLKKNFAKLPLTMACMESRDTFSRYMYSLHELINKMLGKKSGLTYCDVRERYEHFRSRCTEPEPAPKPTKVEQGCVKPLYGTKSRCVIKIVPHTSTEETLQIDDKCLKHA